MRFLGGSSGLRGRTRQPAWREERQFEGSCSCQKHAPKPARSHHLFKNSLRQARRNVFDNSRIHGSSGHRRSIQGREFPRTPTFENRKRRKTLFFVRPWGKLPEDGRIESEEIISWLAITTGSRQILKSPRSRSSTEITHDRRTDPIRFHSGIPRNRTRYQGCACPIQTPSRRPASTASRRRGTV